MDSHDDDADCMAKLGSGQIKPGAHHIACKRSTKLHLLGLTVDDVGLTGAQQLPSRQPQTQPEARDKKGIRVFERAECRCQSDGG